MGVVQEGEASATNEATVTENIPPNMEYAYELRFEHTVADELYLRHNFDVPPSARLHFLRADQHVFLEPRSGDICFYSRMLMAGLHFPLQPIALKLFSI
jgi:hypothetical protein